MKYRQLRVITTGRWVNVLFTVQAKNGAPDVFSVPELSHRTDIARALGLQPTDLEVVDADTDLRVGALLAMPPPAPRQPTVAELAQAQAVSDAAAALVVEIDKAFTARGPVLTAAEKAGIKDKTVDLIARGQGR